MTSKADQKVIGNHAIKALNIQLANSAQQGPRDKALEKLIDLFVVQKQWVSNDSEKEKKETSKPGSVSKHTERKKEISGAVKNLRSLWEGLFFMVWHSDKPQYQKNCMEKIAGILGKLDTVAHQRMWFEQFLFTVNQHWDKVDNFRIDKFLMFLRFQFNGLIQFLKDNQYAPELVKWYQKSIFKIYAAQGMAETAAGILLQISDIFVQEMNKVDAEAPLETLASLLEPFLKSLGAISNKELKERISDNIFKPILENNKTQKDDSDDEEELAKQEHYYRHVDGGKMMPKTVKEIKAILNTKYIFNAFNILIYAQNYILKMASSTDGAVTEDNRDTLYKLYDYALELEPKPEREELTFSQQQLVNKARTFVTMKMKRRQNLRESKQATKDVIRARQVLGDNLTQKQLEILQAIQGNSAEVSKIVKEEEKKSVEDKTKGSTDQKENVEWKKIDKSSALVEKEGGKSENNAGNKRDKKAASKKPQAKSETESSAKTAASSQETSVSIEKVEAKKNESSKVQKTSHKPQVTEVVKAKKVDVPTSKAEKVTTVIKESTNDADDDTIMEIMKTKTKKNKKRKAAKPSQESEPDQKRVRFDLSQNKVTEFFKHGKVATRVLNK